MTNVAIGVYSITAPSGSIYVGMTCDSFASRWKTHRSELRRKVHKNKGLQSAANKYGISNLVFEPLEVFDSLLIDATLEAKILSAEVRWWEDFASQGRKLYNARPTGTGSVHHSSETKLKQSAAAPNLGSGVVRTCVACKVEYRTTRKWRSNVACSVECRAANRSSLTLDPFRSEIEELYSSGKTLHQIGEKFDVSYRTVHKFMVRYEIPRRKS